MNTFKVSKVAATTSIHFPKRDSINLKGYYWIYGGINFPVNKVALWATRIISGINISFINNLSFFLFTIYFTSMKMAIVKKVSKPDH